MRIAVISPMHQTGSTILTALFATIMGRTYNIRTLLTYTGLENRGMSTYLSLDDRRDLSRSLTQVKALRQTRSLSLDDIYEYCTHLDKIVSVLDTNATGIKEDTATKILNTCLEGTEESSDFFFTDITTEVYDQTTQDILKASDLIIVILTQDKKCFDAYKEWKTSNYFKPYLSKCIYCVNRFNPVIGSLRDASKIICEPRNSCFKLDYNPYIVKMCNKGKLLEMVPYILKNDLTVLALSKGVREGVNLVAANNGLVPAKW